MIPLPVEASRIPNERASPQVLIDRRPKECPAGCRTQPAGRRRSPICPRSLVSSGLAMFGMLMVSLGTPCPAQTKMNLGKIMPLGDSITKGAPAGAYRDPLSTLLKNAGYTFQFIGTLTENPSAALTAAGQDHHEGHSSMGMEWIDANLTNFFTANPPDCILLAIGANDVGGATVPELKARMDKLVTDIFSLLPKVKLYLASVTPQTGPIMTKIREFNQLIPGIVASHQAKGRQMIYVSMEALNLQDLEDNVHPNAAGSLKMAQAWHAALAGAETQAVWGKSPIPEPYAYVGNGSFSGPAVPESLDPLVAYRWPAPKASDALEIYLLKPKAVSADKPESFANLTSLAGDSPGVTVKGAGAILLDFGRESAAWVEFDSPDCPGGVEMSISEYNEPAPHKTMAPVKHGDTYRLELNRELYEGVRFAWIHVKAPASPWHIRGIRAVCQVKPTNYAGSFSCSDPMLMKAWYMCAYGVKICLVSNYFSSILMERGDRIPWVGDAPASQAAALVAFGNSDFVKENIDITAGGNNGIIAYSLYWVIGLLDYYYYTGDAAMMEKHINAACSILDNAYKVYGTNPGLRFFGWDERLCAGFEIWFRASSPEAQEAQNAYKMLSIRVWKDFAAAMGAYGRADLQARYSGYAEAKIAALRNNRAWYSEFGLHALAEVAASGLLNSAERKTIVEKEFLDRVNRLSLDPFCQLFIIQAMARMNQYDDAFSSIRDLWGGVIKLGGTAPWECYRPSWNIGIGVTDPVPNSQSGITSLCHPWGAGPVKWLNEEVLGIKPTTPGFRTYDILPHLGRSLTSVSGKTPTPHGEISASFNVSTGICRVTAPAGTVGRIGIPKVEKIITAISINGTVAWDGTGHPVTGIGSASQDSEFVYFTPVQPGTYTMVVSYRGNTPVYHEPPETYAAQFIKLDSTTSGNWGGVYGKDGYVLCNYNGGGVDKNSLPPYVSSVTYFRAFGGSAQDPHRLAPDPVSWASPTSDTRALAPDSTNGTPRNAACVSNSDQTMTLTIGVDGTRDYQVALYFVDWDNQGRREAVEMMDATTLKLVAPVKIVDTFAGGKYLVYTYNKSAKFRFNKIRGETVTLSGIFFDPKP